MNSDLVKRSICNLIRSMELCRDQQNEIDSIYSELCDIIFKEMERKVQSKDGSGKTRKKLRTNKPSWNDELSTL